jgi:hypothetical protein
MIFLRLLICSVLGLVVLAAPIFAQAKRPVAFITELKLGKRGDVNLHLPNGKKQKAMIPINLYPGTRIEVSNDAVVEIYFGDAKESIRVTGKNGSFTVHAPAVKPRSSLSQTVERATIAANGLWKIWNEKKPETDEPGGSRGPRPLGDLILKAPRRHTKLLTKWPQFQWEGRANAAATLKVMGPKGEEVWSVKNLPPKQIQYPQTAPALLPDVYYSWVIEMEGIKYSGGRFKILTDDELGALKARLAEIESQSNLGKATQRVLQISYLISQELYYDARERLIEALETDGNEPTLRLLLAEVYQRTGLDNLAGENAQIAAELATRDISRK